MNELAQDRQQLSRQRSKAERKGCDTEVLKLTNEIKRVDEKWMEKYQSRKDYKTKHNNN
jgi:hypothetical protein